MRNPNYVVGRGKLFFTAFLPGTKTAAGGSRYLGNSPELSLSQDEETLDHYNSDYGTKIKDASVSLQNDQSGSFSLDDISAENLAMWFRGAVERSAIAGGAVTDYAIGATDLGTYVQLGVTPGNPIGARNVSAVVIRNVTKANAVVVEAGNYEIDAVTGRVYILDDAADVDSGDILEADFTAAAGTEEIVVAQGTTIEGRLEFLAANAAGENRDYIWPYVQVSPDGDFSLKGDDWQTMNFNLEILKLNDSTERQYIVKRPTVAA
jgi:hypothetical protein